MKKTPKNFTAGQKLETGDPVYRGKNGRIYKAKPGTVKAAMTLCTRLGCTCQLSKCCGKKAGTFHGDEGTSHFICSGFACGKEFIPGPCESAKKAAKPIRCLCDPSPSKCNFATCPCIKCPIPRAFYLHKEGCPDRKNKNYDASKCTCDSAKSAAGYILPKDIKKQLGVWECKVADTLLRNDKHEEKIRQAAAKEMKQRIVKEIKRLKWADRKGYNAGIDAAIKAIRNIPNGDTAK